tara:strand:- start:39 stop:152 length:114 start_codon:yes stop_codon:yes gene_type:complete
METIILAFLINLYGKNAAFYAVFPIEFLFIKDLRAER